MDDPKIADALAQIDAAVDQAVQETAQRLGIEMPSHRGT